MFRPGTPIIHDIATPASAPAISARCTAPSQPPDAPLRMPAQPINAPRRLAPGESGANWRLAAIMAPAAGITLIAAGLAWEPLSAGGMSALDWLALALITANIAWIALAAATAVAGAIILALGPARLALADAFATDSLAAIVFPIRNEDPVRVTASALAIHDALAGVRCDGAFELFFLSDTNDDAIAHEEEAAVARLCARRPDAVIHYRRRLSNHGRKAGNIADFLTRWGGRYDYMIVLDADSLMTAGALTELVRRMDDQPRTALIQTVPMIVNAQTVIARSQQFAMRAYGPIFTTGLAWWSGGAGNFWGHNAIIRISAFASHAGLPVLPGRGPLAGQIMSHDFVEAALLRRAGWQVEIAPDIVGSYEECPPTLHAIAARDRRWAQGNLQHLKLLGAQGLDPASRAHIFAGIMGYASALLWFALILVGAAQAWFETAGVPVSAAPSILLLVLSVVVVMSPKWLALLLWIAGKLPGWQGRHSFIAGLAVETTFSAVTAPIMMVNQARAVVAPFLGRDAGWRPQARVAGASDSDERYRGQMMFGFFLGATIAINAGFAAWTFPVATSLIFAAPIAAALGRALRRRNWICRALATPEDMSPPAILRSARRAAGRFASQVDAERGATTAGSAQALKEPAVSLAGS
jgi:membrane glycosyltransferase